MKKSLKIVLAILGFLILLTYVDIGSILLRNKPILILARDKCGCSDKMYLGLLYDTYYCSGEDKTYIKLKDSKFSCSFKIETNETDANGWYNGISNEENNK